MELLFVNTDFGVHAYNPFNRQECLKYSVPSNGSCIIDDEIIIIHANKPLIYAFKLQRSIQVPFSTQIRLSKVALRRRKSSFFQESQWLFVPQELENSSLSEFLDLCTFGTWLLADVSTAYSVIFRILTELLRMSILLSLLVLMGWVLKCLFRRIESLHDMGF